MSLAARMRSRVASEKNPAMNSTHHDPFSAPTSQPQSLAPSSAMPLRAPASRRFFLGAHFDIRTQTSDFERMPPRLFLTAEWRHLAMLNFVVDPVVLKPFVPAGTELDSYKGETFLSVVGFRFLNTRVLGFAIPFHRNFEEVNLRFYVRRKTAEGWRRGVVFIKELVPRRAIAFVARTCYGEPYTALPMRHRIDHTTEKIRVEYGWQRQGRWESVHAAAEGQ